MDPKLGILIRALAWQERCQRIGFSTIERKAKKREVTATSPP
jgi:hypothetical protein